MSKKLPVISGKNLISCLIGIGYQVVRQRGSHVRLEKSTNAGLHKITIPNHNPVAKGTLNDIITKISIWNQIPKDTLIEMIKG
ncbi:MAG: type II toxin-antitoxin system HicA family toxin [Desulfobacterales bacterium]|nr:type II toxin-antitoxin system HicA family toxin [Desulfobacterales bacterium]